MAGNVGSSVDLFGPTVEGQLIYYAAYGISLCGTSDGVQLVQCEEYVFFVLR